MTFIEGFKVWWRGYSNADVESLKQKMTDKDPGKIIWLTRGEMAAMRAGECRVDAFDRVIA